jgi:hypothetical protein
MKAIIVVDIAFTRISNDLVVDGFQAPPPLPVHAAIHLVPHWDTSMEKFQTFLFSYSHDGSRWSFEIKAKDRKDAMARLNRISFARYDGELKASIPVTPTSIWRDIAGRFNALTGRGTAF